MGRPIRVSMPILCLNVATLRIKYFTCIDDDDDDDDDVFLYPIFQSYTFNTLINDMCLLTKNVLLLLILYTSLCTIHAITFHPTGYIRLENFS